MISYCLFCATILHHHPFAYCGTVKQEPSDISDESFDNEIITAETDKHELSLAHPYPYFLQINEKDGHGHQLQGHTLFILHEIVKIPRELLCQFLRDNTVNDHDSDIWAQVKICFSCGDLVRQYYKGFQQVPRLDRELDKIVKELKRKIFESKQIQVQGSSVEMSLIWRWVRNYVLLEGDASSPDLVKVKVPDIPGPDYQSDEEELDLAVTHVKMEIIESPSVSMPSILPTFEDSPLSSEWEPVPVPGPHVQLTEPPIFLYNCISCPFKSSDSTTYKIHTKVHLEESLAIPCPDCGVLVFPEKLAAHLYSHRNNSFSSNININKNEASSSSSSTSAQKKVETKRIRTPLRKLSRPRSELKKSKECKVTDKKVCQLVKKKKALHYTTRKEKMNNSISNYRCRHCPYMTQNNLILMEEHVLLHKWGSGGIPCPDCGCYQAPEKLDAHRDSHEPEPVGNEINKYINNYATTSTSAPVVPDAEPDEDQTEESKVLSIIGETVIKTEEVDLGHFYIPTDFKSEPTHIAPEEPSKKLESISCSSQSKPDQLFNHNCPYCQYKSDYTRSFERHLKVHAKGMSSISCENCRVDVISKKLFGHRCFHNKNGVQIRMLGTTLEREKKRIEILKLKYSVHDNNRTSRLYYKCDECPFLAWKRDDMEAHLKLHEPGSLAITCTDCGYFVLPEKMKFHQSTRHPTLNKTDRKKLKQLKKRRKRKKRATNSNHEKGISMLSSST